MTLVLQQLLALVYLALHPDGVVPDVLKGSTVDWQGVFIEASKQSLIGVAYAGLKCALAKNGKSNIQIDHILLV